MDRKTFYKIIYILIIIKMKNYLLGDDIQFIYLAKSKKDLIEYIKICKSNKDDFLYDEKIKDLNVRFIKYNAKKIDIDNAFGDIYATNKINGDDIEYDDYEKYGIKDGICKKDFLYYNL